MARANLVIQSFAPPLPNAKFRGCVTLKLEPVRSPLHKMVLAVVTESHALKATRALAVVASRALIQRMGLNVVKGSNALMAFVCPLWSPWSLHK